MVLARPGSAGEESLCVFFLCIFVLPLLVTVLCCCRAIRLPRGRRSSKRMDTFDLNQDYEPLDDESFVPCTQLDDTPENVQAYEILQTTPQPGSGSPLSAITNAPPALPTPSTFKRRTLCPPPPTSIGHTSRKRPPIASKHVFSQQQDSQSDDWDSSLDDINVPLPSLQPSTTPSSIERGCNWLEHETFLLLEGKKRLDNDMQQGTLRKSMRSNTQRWDFVSSYLNEMGVVKTPHQCEYRWLRLWKPFKSIFDYEKQIPSGQDSYWNLGAMERTSKKLPRSFDRKLFTCMRDKFLADRAVNPGDIQIDSSATHIHSSPVQVSSGDEQGASSDKSRNPDIDVPARFDYEDIASGKKRTRPVRSHALKKDFQDCTKQLLHVIDNVEKERNQTQREVMEISRTDFETSVKLQHERIVAAQHSSDALKEIASALKTFTAGFSSSA